MGMAAAASAASAAAAACALRRPLPSPPRRLLPSALRCCSSPTASASASASASSSYNGWADLAAAPDLPIFPLPIQSPTHAHGLLILLPAAAVLALSLSLSRLRLPPLPLLAAAFTAGFAARHLSDSAQPRPPGRLAAALADLDAQARALRDQLLAASSDSDSDPALLLVQAVDRLRDALADATADHTPVSDVPPPVLGTFGELAHCFRAWARHAVRDLSPSTPRKKQPHKPTASDSNNNTRDSSSTHAAASAPQQQQGIAEDMLPDDPLERLVFKHHRRPFQAAASSTSSRFATGSMESSTLEIRDRSYRLKIQRQANEASPDDERLVGKAAAGLDPIPIYDETDDGSGSDAQEFSRNVEDAAEMLNKAKECMMAATADQEAADALLYKSARLLSTAVALRPTSLVAVGQLGNTYLLHGELKLKVSRELRQLLANSSTFPNGAREWPRKLKLDTRILSRDSISSALVGVCEECESLLVEAGRSYKTALSIDSGDVKALYNWGLALIFRAQLLADIGPEAAVDADRVYLAAIDKFDAMLSKSNTYAPEALYRWGTALQQRSHLRPRNNKDKIRLLEQAKSLFEDVLYVEADNKLVREALSSCVAELNYHGRWL